MDSFEQLSRLVLVPRCSGSWNSAKDREMTNWDERADDLRRERREAEAIEASKRQAMAEAEAKEHAKWQAVYDKLADVARWAIGRYQTANTPPTPIYVTWEEEVRVSRCESRVEPRKTRIGVAYLLYTYSYHPNREDYVTSVLMVTPVGQVIWHDDSETFVTSGRLGLPHVGPAYRFGDENLIWSKSRPTSNLMDYMRLVENHSVRDELRSFGRSLELDKFLDEIVEFVDRRTRS
jgi:hypothetical protein